MSNLISLPGEREEELLELYTDDAIGFKLAQQFTVNIKEGSYVFQSKTFKNVEKEKNHSRVVGE